jgi:tetratricopeptide (TPR) repeat protein
MSITTEIELKKLIRELEKEPSNLDLINSVAIGYFENSVLKTDKEDYDFFEKAYQIKKTIKSTHNFAWFLYFEWSEIEWRRSENIAIEKALRIQKECLELSPNSFYPHYQMGYMLLDQGEFKEAIQHLEKAYSIESRRDILHNLGYCYFHIANFEKAKGFFKSSKTELDVENKSLYNLALSEISSLNIESAKSITDLLFQKISGDIHYSVCGYEIGVLYFILGHYEMASACIFKQGIDGVDLFGWDELSYSFYVTSKETWQKYISEGIKERQEWIKEIIQNHKDWADSTETEKKERLSQFELDINTRKSALKNGVPKPRIELKNYIKLEHSGCLLFDCKRHQNQSDD